METKMSLREWAKENTVWEPKVWKNFLEEDIVPLYKYAYTLDTLYKFLKSAGICGKSSLADIEDETLRNKVRAAIYGGVEQNKDSSMSFAKFMYDNFGICAENAPSFEDSTKHYESWGDSIKVSVNAESWINSMPIGSFVDEMEILIQRFCDKLTIKLTEVGIQESYPSPPIEVINPDDLLPQPAKKPETLVELINNFKQKALDLSVGVNPFMTFVFYSRTIPLLTLMEFLECDIDKITKLAGFLGLKVYSMIDQTEVSLPTKSPNKAILLLTRESLFDRILGLQSFLRKIDPIIKQIYVDMIKQAADQIHVTFEPWKDYEPIFSALANLMDDRDVCQLEVEQGRIVKVNNQYGRRYWKFKEMELSGKILLRDFLINISPLLNAGIVTLGYTITQLAFHPLAREWIEKVIDNEGNT